MSEIKIAKLTREQEAMIPIYKEKWRALLLSTQPIDRIEASSAVKAAYAIIDRKEPEIVFCDSPYAAFSKLESQLQYQRRSYGERLQRLLGSLRKPPLDSLLNVQLGRQLQNQLQGQLGVQIGKQLQDQLWRQLVIQLNSHPQNQLRRQLNSHLQNQLQKQLGKQIWSRLGWQIGNWTTFDSWTYYGSWLDFCISVLNCYYNPQLWKVFQLLVSDCAWILPYEKMCLVCDRPTKLSFDNQERLHAEGCPAIQFVDNFSVYAYNGVRLPEKYGQLHPHQWQGQWLLLENNAEIRRVLIQGIGYARLCSELKATELDYWAEYTLLKIDSDIDVEPIHLLKMTCPSTGYIYALRVPSDIKSAREAIYWINWGIDPENFSQQT